MMQGVAIPVKQERNPTELRLLVRVVMLVNILFRAHLSALIVLPELPLLLGENARSVQKASSTMQTAENVKIVKMALTRLLMAQHSALRVKGKYLTKKTAAKCVKQERSLMMTTVSRVKKEKFPKLAVQPVISVLPEHSETVYPRASYVQREKNNLLAVRRSVSYVTSKEESFKHKRVQPTVRPPHLGTSYIWRAIQRTKYRARRTLTRLEELVRAASVSLVKGSTRTVPALPTATSVSSTSTVLAIAEQ